MENLHVKTEQIEALYVLSGIFIDLTNLTNNFCDLYKKSDNWIIECK